MVNGASFIFVIGALLLVRERPDPAAPPRTTTMLEEVCEGLVYALGTPRIRLALGVLFVISVFVFNFNVYVPLLAREVLHQEADGFGFLMASLGVGAVSGALDPRHPRARAPAMPVAFAACLVACAGIFACRGCTRSGRARSRLFVTGFFSVVVTATCNTTLQLTAPDALRGRVMSLYTLVFGGTVPFGAFMVGLISEHWSVPMAFLAMGSAGLVGCELPPLLPCHPRRRHADRDGRAAREGGHGALHSRRRHARRVGVNAPRVLHRDAERGLPAQFGSGLANVPDGTGSRGDADRLYADAIEALVRIQSRGDAHAARCHPTTMRCCAGKWRCFRSGFAPGICGLTLTGDDAAGARGCVRCPGRNSAATATCLRPSRLSLAQSHGRRRRTPRRQSGHPGLPGRSLRTGHV